MTEAELDVHLRECYPEHRFTEPYVWRKGRYDRPAQPVVGVCWHEARAYCAWLSAQTGEAYRLPTEVEWEAAARGQAGRAFAFGDAFDEQKANTVETRARRTTPVGVFVGGDTPEGVSDLSGNTWEWTSSLFGMDQFVPDYAYPYRAQDGRESAEAGNYVMPVVRGGAYNLDHAMARAAFRIGDMPCLRYSNNGFRLASPG
jgi:formylglycine-generating enzyme required for sulfatase activity